MKSSKRLGCNYKRNYPQWTYSITHNGTQVWLNHYITLNYKTQSSNLLKLLEDFFIKQFAHKIIFFSIYMKKYNEHISFLFKKKQFINK
jgi:hypothetical protein